MVCFIKHFSSKYWLFTELNVKSFFSFLKSCYGNKLDIWIEYSNKSIPCDSLWDQLRSSVYQQYDNVIIEVIAMEHLT